MRRNKKVLYPTYGYHHLSKWFLFKNIYIKKIRKKNLVRKTNSSVGVQYDRFAMPRVTQVLIGGKVLPRKALQTGYEPKHDCLTWDGWGYSLLIIWENINYCSVCGLFKFANRHVSKYERITYTTKFWIV